MNENSKAKELVFSTARVILPKKIRTLIWKSIRPLRPIINFFNYSLLNYQKFPLLLLQLIKRNIYVMHSKMFDVKRHIHAFRAGPSDYLIDSLIFQNRFRTVKKIGVWFFRSRGELHRLKLRNRYHMRRSFRKGHTRINNYPKLLHVEMTTSCNLRCQMCSIVRPGRTRKIQHLDMEVMRRLEDILPFVTDTKMHGGGEPFLNPHIEKIIRTFQKYDVKLNTVTNATLINEKLAKLIGLNFSTLTVSMDGASKEVFEYVRKRADYGKVIKALELLNKYRHEDFKLIIGFVIMRCNAHELPDLVRLAKKHGAQEVQAAWLVPFHDLPWTDENDPTREPERMNRLLKESVILGKKIGVSVKIPPLLPEQGGKAKAVEGHKPTYHNLHPTTDVEGHCKLMYDRCMVLVDGNLKPCGQSRFVDDLGTLKEQSFEDIWSGSGYQRLRSTFNGGTLPKTCRSCNFIRSGQLGDAKLVIKTFDGERLPIMNLVGER
ncbi:radical SAM protein [Aestuariibacter salexigens]|uniref:radical SAM protein n=1 Tax=Aestuariibacter salexigens TaxID=226010 RepID=UPI0004143EA9|nr:radical SAM protein [Aestuariibacter salexigens]